MDNPSKRRISILAIVILCLIVLVSLLLGSFKYSVNRAQTSAANFCNEIAVGSDIKAAVVAANEKGILIGPGTQYVFIFPTFTGFDKAVCRVWIDSKERVVSKQSEMEFD